MDAPSSGHDNPHYFDNAAMIRALGIVTAFAGDKEELIDLIELDASHTHSEDGVWAAVAVGLLAFEIHKGIDLQVALSNSIEILPEDSWSRREVNRALEVVKETPELSDRVFKLESRFVDRIYPYPYAASESLGLLIAHLSFNVEPELMFSASFQHKRHTDSLPVLIGFFLGLIHGESWLPKSFLNEAITLDGVSIPNLKGLRFI
jgi:ADP-ribosylglycohydrolase